MTDTKSEDTTVQGELDRILDEALKLIRPVRKVTNGTGIMHLDSARSLLKMDLTALINKEIAIMEKAYGGCHNCYGKGYATFNGAWQGYDTDTDIGSPGGPVSGGKRNAMKFCTCGRGKQLEERLRGYDV